MNQTYHPKDVCLCGYYKDASSYYLDYFKEVWAFEAHVAKMNLSATNIRENYFSRSPNVVGWKKDVPKAIAHYLEEYREKRPEQHQYFVDEYQHIRDYQTRNQPRPGEKRHPVQFITVDNVVVQNGHVLMVTRKGMPGKGQWALPGGFVSPNESLLNAALRELKEETSIKLNKSILRRQLTDQHVFDHPKRDLRGRIITHGFFYRLEDNKPLPEVKGGDDAAKAFWVPWDEIITHANRVYSDHVHILSYFLNRF
jgi:bifunctional NMN adenylyltransferase/nudix hydrolase